MLSLIPGEIYILGAHHDDYSDTNLYLFAPGANDSLSHCQMDLVAGASRVISAILLSEQLMPDPVVLIPIIESD